MKFNMAKKVLKGNSSDGGGGGRGFGWHGACRRRISGHTGVISIGFSTDFTESFPLMLYLEGNVSSNCSDWCD